MLLTTPEINALRRTCQRFLNGHRQLEPAIEFANMAKWCEVNQVTHDTYGEGALIQHFENQIAHLLGMEAAAFCITGTMAQTIVLRLACEARGNKLVALHPTSHILKHERSNFELLNHFHALQIGDPFRPWSLNDLKAIADPLAAAQIELPMREIGGQLPLWEELSAIKAHCREENLHLHMDGARLWEAAPGYGRTHQEIAAGFDSVYVSFYKGVGAMGGAMLLGSTSFIAQARAWMQRLGGNVFRRSPYVVSAAMQFEKRIAETPAYFQRTQWLYEILRAYPQFAANPNAPQSNMLHLYLPVSADKATAIRNTIAREHGIWMFGRAVNTALPQQCMFEWTVGDQLLQMPDVEVCNAVRLLAEELGSEQAGE